MELLTTTHSKHISGVLSCFDRIILTGKLPQVCYAQGKYLHYYFYFIDPYLGYGYVRVPTWCPFKLQIYINGHNILANKLDIKKIHQRLDELARTYCPAHLSFNRAYHWSIMQAEYATDIVFKNNPTCSRCIQS